MNNYWPRNNINFTSYNKNSNDKIVLHCKKDITDEFIYYSNNYFQAAEILKDNLITICCDTQDIAALDTWFFPVTYLYRQSLELLLKATLYKYKVYENDILSKMRHNLSIGLTLLETKLDKSILDDNNYIWLFKYFENITLTDSESDIFRYPIDNKENSNFPKKQSNDYIKISENIFRSRESLKYLLNHNNLINFSSEYNHQPILLIEGGDHFQSAIIGYKYSQKDFYPYIKSYNECANFLLKKINSNKSYTNLFLPMCYLFRNALELQLKKLYILHCDLNNEKCNLLKYKHKLWKLWKVIEPTINRSISDNDDPIYLTYCSNYIKQISDWDGCSSKFRYPINKTGYLFFKKEKLYNINNIGKCFNDINYFLLCLEYCLDNYLDNLAFLNDIESELLNYNDY